MCKRVISLLVLVLLLVPASGAWAKTWTNLGVGDSWCTAGNWAPVGVPLATDVAEIDPPVAGPIVDLGCAAVALEVWGPVSSTAGVQAMHIIGGSLAIGGEWRWANISSSTATINISGSPTVSIGSRWRGVDHGTGILNITGNPIITVADDWRVADDDDAWAVINVSDNAIITTTGDFMFGDDGSGLINISGNSDISVAGDWRMVCRNGGNVTTNISGNPEIWAGGDLRAGDSDVSPGSATINMIGGTVNVNNLLLPADLDASALLDMTGGYVVVRDHMEIGGPAASTGHVILCGGTIYAHTFGMRTGGGTGTMEICCGSGNGTLIVDDVDGSVKTTIEGYVANGWISCVDPTCCVQVEWNGAIIGTTTVTCVLACEKAWNPSPPDGADCVKLDAVLSWSPGCGAIEHDVYLGTDFVAVSNAGVGSTEYMGRQSPNSYTPALLQRCTKYYWRIDERCSGGLLKKGDVWSFTTLCKWCHLKWSQPPIEIDPNANTPTFCGWDEIAGGCEPNCWDYPGQPYGDADGDGSVGMLDLGILNAAYDTVSGDPNYNPCADFDHDGDVDIQDLNMLQSNWGAYYEPAPECHWHMVADDFRCFGTMPVTSVHWWGSYVGWSEPYPPEPNVLPTAWRIGFWSDVPAPPDPCADANYSHPEELLWQVEVDADRVEVEHVGEDWFPHPNIPSDTCFQYYVQLDPNEWFWQDPNGGSRTFLDGTEDNFVGPEPSSPRTQLVAICDPFKGFDDPNVDRCFAHTIGALPSCIIAATLEIRLRAGNSGAECNDSISLQVTGGIPTFRWSRRIGTGGPDTWCAGPAGLLPDPWTSGSTHTFVFDLDALPLTPVGTVSILDLINRDNVLDIYVQDDTAVDYVRLTVSTNCNVYWLSIAAIQPDGGGYVLLDDFESYANNSELWNKWIDGAHGGNGTGSDIQLETVIVHQGAQSMVYLYDNTVNWGAGYYSQIERTFDPAEDWSAMKCLGLWFYGDPDNDLDDMWVVLSDGTSEAQSTYGAHGEDPANIQVPEWQCWPILLSDLAAIDLSNVESISIGFGDRASPVPGGSGVVYFDDIGLGRERCCVSEPSYPWGWKTRPWSWMDDAVRFTYDGPLEPGIVLDPCSVEPIEDPTYGESFDVAFELDTDPNWIKWEQPFTGIRTWPHYEDEQSWGSECTGPNVFVIEHLVADDWRCDSNRPVTAAVWWGSYIGYGYEACQGQVPSRFKPTYFLLRIWDDVPANPGDPCSFSHPNDVIWEYKAYDYDEVLVGYDKHPEGQTGFQPEPVFRYSVALPCKAWFYQDVNDGVYWFSVAAMYDCLYPGLPWGWTNHEHNFNDDAVAGTFDPPGGWFWDELFDQTGASQDMSFMLFTDPDPNLGTCWNICQCPCQPRGDCTCDGRVNFADLFCLKAHFSKCAPWVDPECCADFDHSGCVNFADLFALKTNFGLVCPLPSTGNQKCP